MDTINLSQITIDGGTQMRAEINQQTVAEYADAMSNGAEFPPLVIFTDGAHNWLADGFHRFHAARQAGLAELSADKRTGTLREAVLYAATANTSHGLRRTNADKRKAVMALLEDDEWSEWTDSEIARRCGVDHKTVAAHRGSLGNFPSDSGQRTYTTKHGTTAKMNTSKIGKKRADPKSAEERIAQIKPLFEAGMTLGEVADDLGMSSQQVRKTAKKFGIKFDHTNAITSQRQKDAKVIRQTVYSIRDVASNFRSLEPNFNAIDGDEAKRLLDLLLPAITTVTQIKNQLRAIQ